MFTPAMSRDDATLTIPVHSRLGSSVASLRERMRMNAIVVGHAQPAKSSFG
jgi:hypothetical protein